jgi:hypothetical protein
MYRVLCIALLAVGVLLGCNQTPTPVNLETSTKLRLAAVGTSYYVDSSGGNDANNGSSAGTAWRSLAKVNGFTFQPGDELLFKAGEVWSGQLHPKGSGNSANIIAIDQYGTGNKPRFDGQGSVTDTVYLENQEYWDIKNIEVTNDSTSADSRNGIRVRNSTGGLLNHIHIQNTYVHNVKNLMNGYYGKNAGIAVEADLMTSRWNDVLIDSNTVSTIERIAIFVGPTLENGPVQTATTSTGVVISNNSLSDLGGDGILSYVTDGTQIRRNTINGHAKRQTLTCLEVGYCNAYTDGIWMAVANNTVVEENEVYGGVGTLDGLAYDIDFSSDNVKIQYNYSHDNAGGFLLVVSDSATNGAADNEGAIVRYNISQNDGRGIEFFPDSLNASNKMDVHNNTFFVPSGKNVKLIARQNGQSLTHAFNYRNNIVYNLGTATYPGTQVGVYANNTFYGNHDGSEPSGTNKLTSDPMFVNPGSGGVGRASVNGYKLQTGSPALASGVSISNNGGRDYFGNPVASGGVTDRGVYQVSTGTGGTGNGLVMNGDFENGTASWSVLGGGLVNNGAQSGNNAFQTNPSFGGLTQVISGLAPNTDYTLTGWAKVGTAGEPVYIGVKNYGDVEKNSDVTSTNYTQVVVPFKTGSSSTSAEIYCWRNNGTTPAVCDNFVVVQGTQVPTVVSANGDFENGTASWNPVGGSLVSSGAQSGNNAFQTNPAFSGVFQTISGLLPNTQYTLSGWAKVGTAGEPVYIGVKNYGGMEQNSAVTSTNYTQVSLTFTTGSNSTAAEIYCWRNGGTTPAACDNFKVVGGASTSPNPTLVNLAVGATVTASSSIENYGFLLSMLLDGNRNSGWSSDGNLTVNHTEWVELDLGAVKTFNRVDLYPRNDSSMIGDGFPVDFTIDVWNGSGWNNAITRTGYAKPGNAVQTFTFASENTNRIRIQGSSLRPISSDSNKYRMQLNEIEVFLQ